MATLNEVFGEYDPEKPLISIDKDLLQSLADLPYLLPQSPAEGLYDTYNFYKNQIPFINSENPAEAIKEALLIGLGKPLKEVNKLNANNLRTRLRRGIQRLRPLTQQIVDNSPTIAKGIKFDLKPKDLIDKFKESTLMRTVFNPDRLTTVSQKGATIAPTTPVQNNVMGPFNKGGTNSNAVNATGHMPVNTNSLPYKEGRNHGATNGGMGWQGEMYSPLRKPANPNMYGPFQWENKITRNMDNKLNELEHKWDYLVNATRDSRGHKGFPKKDAEYIAINQGRPDIAARIEADNAPAIPVHADKKFVSYASTKNKDLGGDMEKFMDISNRSVEKDLRENFALLPNDAKIRSVFSERYGTYDLFDDWTKNPQEWENFRKETLLKRYNRDNMNKHNARKYGKK